MYVSIMHELKDENYNVRDKEHLIEFYPYFYFRLCILKNGILKNKVYFAWHCTTQLKKTYSSLIKSL